MSAVLPVFMSMKLNAIGRNCETIPGTRAGQADRFQCQD